VGCVLVIELLRGTVRLKYLWNVAVYFCVNKLVVVGRVLCLACCLVSREGDCLSLFCQYSHVQLYCAGGS
jgi:hypothetical protein